MEKIEKFAIVVIVLILVGMGIVLYTKHDKPVRSDEPNVTETKPIIVPEAPASCRHEDGTVFDCKG